MDLAFPEIYIFCFILQALGATLFLCSQCTSLSPCGNFKHGSEIVGATTNACVPSNPYVET